MATYETIPKESEPLVAAAPKESKRTGAIVVAAVLMMFAAGAGAAALSSKRKATAPAALAAYDGSGVAWDCAVPDSQVAASNGASSGTIESAGFTVRNAPTTRRARCATSVMVRATKKDSCVGARVEAKTVSRTCPAWRGWHGSRSNNLR